MFKLYLKLCCGKEKKVISLIKIEINKDTYNFKYNKHRFPFFC